MSAIQVIKLRLPTSAPTGWEFLDAATKRRAKLKPLNALALYFPCDEAANVPPRDALYEAETLTPTSLCVPGAAGETGFGTRVSSPQDYAGLVASFTAWMIANINCWTIRFRYKPTGVGGWLCPVSFGAYNTSISWHVWQYLTNLQVLLSTNGTSSTTYTCSGLTLVAGTNYQLQFAYQYVANGTSKLRVSVNGAPYLDITNAIGPLNAALTQVLTLCADNGPAATPYATINGCPGLYDEIELYAAFLGATYTPNTAPLKPYPVDQPALAYQAAASSGPSTWDMSTLTPDGENLSSAEFRYRTDGGAWSAWMTAAALQAETDPALKTTFELEARPVVAYDGAVATCPIICNGHIEATPTLQATDADYVALEASRNNDNGTVAGDIRTSKSVKIRAATMNGSYAPPVPPSGPPTLDSLMIDQATGAVTVEWTPADAGDTGGLYGRLVTALPAAWSFLDSGTGDLEATLPTTGLWEFCVQERSPSGYYAPAPSPITRGYYADDASPLEALRAEVLALLLADPAVAAACGTRLASDIDNRRLPPRNGWRLPYVEFKAQPSVNSDYTEETVLERVTLQFRVTAGAEVQTEDQVYRLLRDIAAALRGGLKTPEHYLAWRITGHEKRGRFWRVEAQAEITVRATHPGLEEK